MQFDPNADKYFKGILGKTGDDTYQVPRLDASTHAIETIEYDHHEIHGGSSFTAYYTRTTDATDAHRSAIYLLTPESIPEVHIIVHFSASFAAFFTICEAITITLNHGGHNRVIINRNRNSLNTSKARDNATAHTANVLTTFTEVELAAAGFAPGTIIRTEPIIAGGGPKPAGGEYRGAQEYILKRNTPYLFLLTNVGANANVHHIHADWYEHEPKGK